MPDPIQEPANQPGQATPPPTPPQQAPPTSLTPPAAPATPPATPPVPPAPPAQTTQQLAELQRQNQEAQRKITEQGQELGQLRRQRDALAGIAPQAPVADPLAPHIAALVAKGYNAQEARDMVETTAAMMQPHIQALHQTQQATQGVAMVTDVMREAYTSNAPLFAIPGVFQKVEADLRGQAMKGGIVDVPYAVAIAKIEWADATLAMQGGGTPPAQPPALPPSFGSMFGPPGGGGFQAPTPPPTGEPALTPLQQKWDAEIRARFLPKPQA